MSDAAEALPAPTRPPTVQLESIYATPAAERPQSETLDGVSAWLDGAARREASLAKVIDEFGWRLTAAGLGLLRVAINISTLHPQFVAAAYVWWKDTAETRKLMVMHEVMDVVPYANNPIAQTRDENRIIRRRIEGETEFEFTVLPDLQARGGTDYLSLPVESPFGFQRHVVSYVSDAPGGFRQAEIDLLTSYARALAIIVDMRSQRQIAENVLSAYLGAQTGPRVLNGHVRRGSGENICAAIWSSDLRGFTAFSDHAPSAKVIATLNALFEVQGRAIVAHGGEILKFVGDGLLAIFPAETPQAARESAAAALAAAREVQSALQGHDLKLVIALHFGEVVYGNIGASDRVDFTVIGPAVNLASRLEAVAKAHDLPLVMSDDFAGVLATPDVLTSLGAHALRGLDKPHELFAARG